MSYFLSDNPGPNLADALVKHSSLPKPNVAALAFFTRLQLLISRTDMREGEDYRLCDLCLGGDGRRKSRNRFEGNLIPGLKRISVQSLLVYSGCSFRVIAKQRHPRFPTW